MVLFILLLLYEGKEELSVWKTFKRIWQPTWEYNRAVIPLKLIQSFCRTVKQSRLDLGWPQLGKKLDHGFRDHQDPRWSLGGTVVATDGIYWSATPEASQISQQSRRSLKRHNTETLCMWPTYSNIPSAECAGRREKTHLQEQGHSNPTPGHIPWGNQNWKKHMYPNVHCSAIYNC